MSEITIAKAKLLSRIAHDSIGQKRKYTGEPYYSHPYDVVMILHYHKLYTFYDELIVAAYLHDMLEDVEPINPYFNKELIINIFGIDLGRQASDTVYELTTDNKRFSGNRAERHIKKLEHYSSISTHASLIKLADIIDNCSSIVKHDKDFAKVYIRECLEIAKVLQDNIDITNIDQSGLYDRCMLTLYKAKDELGWEI